MSTNSTPRTPGDQPPSQPKYARVRRRPNIPAFLGTGALVGVILGVLFAHTSPNGGYSEFTATAAVAIVFAVAGLLVAALAIIAIDKRIDR